MTKHEAVLELLEKGTVQIAIETANATLPIDLKQQSHVILDIGYDMAIPIPDLKVDHRGVSGTLVFNHRPAWVYFRWADVVQYRLRDAPVLSSPPPAPKKKRALPKGWAVLEGGKK